MSDIVSSMIDMWDRALDHYDRPEDALALLADTIAFGLNEGDFDYRPILDRIVSSFDQLHVAKHMRVKQ
ncbi:MULTISPECIES: hypothetical protein [unclassified Paracoccus (in: a-proteobacteria)]|uniref:hypothetical protein n=1 Tax=unclassified Paracoccus (in: a-proteobacteria) TaxID=2688777 RepID=UPI0012B304B5|nr:MULTISPECIES: hypothetical protein [unclassified Paracoccus (in: a-proteobacteria)]UXU73801.1 hypothetical protein GB879_007580 [Paracoccus sp. SMMA_5]UXU79691.1 hypothetical protein GB880_007570 [Paracoccus sp. SMMA_5_TC]